YRLGTPKRPEHCTCAGSRIAMIKGRSRPGTLSPPFDHAALFLWFGQFFGLGEVFQVVQAEELQEAFRGAVEDGAAGFFGSAGDVDEVLFHEGADGFAAGYASDGF